MCKVLCENLEVRMPFGVVTELIEMSVIRIHVAIMFRSFVVLADMHEIEDELHKLEVENRKREVWVFVSQ
ncbi:hypothetical protein JHK87_021460 [Glycine soja]|nr:hypothetical protein JHK87_021460 [Glycine soja]